MDIEFQRNIHVFCSKLREKHAGSEDASDDKRPDLLIPEAERVRRRKAAMKWKKVMRQREASRHFNYRVQSAHVELGYHI